MKTSLVWPSRCKNGQSARSPRLSDGAIEPTAEKAAEGCPTWIPPCGLAGRRSDGTRQRYKVGSCEPIMGKKLTALIVVAY